MNDGNFKKLFIATHLLYPNSAQARDIVFQISTQLRTKINKANGENELSVYYSALVQIYKKVVSIKSGFKFFEFKDQKLNDWQNVLKKCNSNEILIFLAIAILKLDVNSIANIMKISVNQTYYLFSLAIRKAIGSQDPKQFLSYTFQYKKFNEEQNTFSNLIEKAIEYVYLKTPEGMAFEDFMEQQGQDVDQASQNGISYIFKKIQSLYEEVNQIEIDEKFLEEFKKETFEYFESQKSSYKIEWKYTGLIFLVSCSLLFFYFKPNFTNLLNFYDGYSVIEIKEISFKNPDSNKVDEALLAENISPSNGLPNPLLNKNPTVAVTPEKTLPVATAPAVQSAETKQPSEPNSNKLVVPKSKMASGQTPTLPENTQGQAQNIEGAQNHSATGKNLNEAENQKNQAKMAGGLYRAELLVKDFEQNTLFAKEKIINYGGKKAGEVELGWIKNKKTSYFHFSIPEENIEKMKADLELLGKLEITFAAHPRLMPVGIKRVILEVKLVD